MPIKLVTLWSNGMLMVFGEDGEQMAEYQGKAVTTDSGLLCDLCIRVSRPPGAAAREEA